MLETVYREKLSSYLSANVTATSTSYIDSGLSVYLAPNRVYAIRGFLDVWANGDGSKIKILYTGTEKFARFGVVRTASAGGTSFALGDEVADAAVDQTLHLTGTVASGTGGKLYLQFAKNTDVTDDTPIVVGSFLTAQNIT
jgi:hypothetical protein